MSCLGNFNSPSVVNLCLRITKTLSILCMFLFCSITVSTGQHCSPVVTSCFHGDRVRRWAMAWDGDEVGSLPRVVRLHTGWRVRDGLRDDFSCKQHQTPLRIHSDQDNTSCLWSTPQCSNLRRQRANLPTGMAEVVTAVAWEECDAIVMVTIVLLVIWLCGTEPI